MDFLYACTINASEIKKRNNWKLKMIIFYKTISSVIIRSLAFNKSAYQLLTLIRKLAIKFVFGIKIFIEPKSYSRHCTPTCCEYMIRQLWHRVLREHEYKNENALQELFTIHSAAVFDSFRVHRSVSIVYLKFLFRFF